MIAIIGPHPKIAKTCRDLGWSMSKGVRHETLVTTGHIRDVRPVFGIMGLRTLPPFAKVFLSYGWTDAFNGIEEDEARALMQAKRVHELTYAEARAL